jgi:hypothetical protein
VIEEHGRQAAGVDLNRACVPARFAGGRYFSRVRRSQSAHLLSVWLQLMETRCGRQHRSWRGGARGARSCCDLAPLWLCVSRLDGVAEPPSVHGAAALSSRSPQAKPRHGLWPSRGGWGIGARDRMSRQLLRGARSLPASGNGVATWGSAHAQANVFDSALRASAVAFSKALKPSR